MKTGIKERFEYFCIIYRFCDLQIAKLMQHITYKTTCDRKILNYEQQQMLKALWLVLRILNVSYPLSSNFFLPLRPTDLLAPYPRILSADVLPLIGGTKFHTHIIHRNAKAPNNSYSFSVSIFDNGRL